VPCRAVGDSRRIDDEHGLLIVRATRESIGARHEHPSARVEHGDADLLVPARQSERLHEALLAAGGTSTLELVAGYNHMLTGIPAADLEALVDRTAACLLAHGVGRAQHRGNIEDR
jgi:hypothetical protein